MVDLICGHPLTKFEARVVVNHGWGHEFHVHNLLCSRNLHSVMHVMGSALTLMGVMDGRGCSGFIIYYIQF